MAPAHLCSLADYDIQGYHGNHEGHKAEPVKGCGVFPFHPAFRGAIYEGKGCRGYEDGKEENIPPAEGACHSPSEEGAEAAAAPGTHGEVGKGPLPRRSFVVRFNEGQGGRHDAGSREALDDASCHEENAGACGGEGDHEGTGGREDDACKNHLYAADFISEAPQDYDEDA